MTEQAVLRIKLINTLMGRDGRGPKLQVVYI